jgi:mRNA interferase MazF
MPISGDVVDLDLGAPEGHEAGYRHPAVVVTAQRILDASPSVIHVVPLTSTIRRFDAEIVLAPDVGNKLSVESAAQCQHLRSVPPRRILEVRGNVGSDRRVARHPLTRHRSRAAPHPRLWRW